MPCLHSGKGTLRALVGWEPCRHALLWQQGGDHSELLQRTARPTFRTTHTDLVPVKTLASSWACTHVQDAISTPRLQTDRALGEGQVHIHQGDQMASCQLLTWTAGPEMSRYWLCRSRKHCASKLKEITRSHITPKTMQVQLTSADLILEWWYTCKYFCTRPALLISLKLI